MIGKSMGNMVGWAIYVAFVLSFSGHSFASDDGISSKIKLCVNIDNSVARLECYDGLGSNFKNNNIKKEKGQSRNWSIVEEKSKIDDSSTVVISTESIEKISNQFDHNVRPTLILRCMEKKTSLYVVWDTFLGSETIRLTRRIDDEKPTEETWHISTNYKASFSGNPVQFIKKLIGRKKVLFRVVPYGDSQKIVEFNIEGLEDVIGPLRTACKW